jgi:hypothetical protein
MYLCQVSSGFTLVQLQDATGLGGSKRKQNRERKKRKKEKKERKGKEMKKRGRPPFFQQYTA